MNPWPSARGAALGRPGRGALRRPWERLRPRTTPTGAQLCGYVLLLATTGVYCWMAWTTLAHRTFPLSDAPSAQPTRTLTDDLRKDPVPPSSARGSSPVDHRRTDAGSTATRSAPGVLHGSTIAVVVMVGIVGLALAVLRQMRRRDVSDRAAASGRTDLQTAERALRHEGDPKEDTDAAGIDAHGPDPDTTAVVPAATGVPGAIVPAATTTPDLVSADVSTTTRAEGRTNSLLFDRRGSARMPWAVPAWVSWDGGSLWATTIDLSAGGLGCRQFSGSATAPVMGTRVEVSVTLHGTVHQFHARVAWSRSEDGRAVMGLEFRDLTVAQNELVHRVLRGEQGEP